MTSVYLSLVLFALLRRYRKQKLNTHTYYLIIADCLAMAGQGCLFSFILFPSFLYPKTETMDPKRYFLANLIMQSGLVATE